MAKNKIGAQTMVCATPPVIVGWGNLAGLKEQQGPLGERFDETDSDPYFGQETWEQAEIYMQRRALYHALHRSGRQVSNLNCMLAGDLLNQCISSSFAARDSNVPFLGIYTACATMSEGLGLAALMVDGGYADCVAAVTSSHFCSAERQYRMPLPYGGQRSPTAQWTATAAGAVVLAAEGRGPRIAQVTFGKIVDWGITDQTNMGAAMAPAAYDSLSVYFRDTGTKPSDFDLVVTGDLGHLGSKILREFLEKDGLDTSNCTDCGMVLFDKKEQDVHAGGSGAGCSAAVLTAELLPQLAAGAYKKLLFCATGALLSPVTAQQKESIPGVCHVICLEGVAV